MSRTQIVIRSPADAVFDVLTEPRSYPRWVVGAHAIRDVDPRWPRPGSAFHHTVGVWPVRIDDSTTMVRARRPDLVVLRARAWPLGEAEVRLELNERDGSTRVTMYEHPVEGPGRAMSRAPVEWITTVRNRRSLARLKELVESRASRPAA